MKVTVHAGLTFHMGPMSGNQYGRVDVTLTDIDPDQPIAPQIAAGKATAAKAFDVIVAEIDREVDIILKGGR